MPKHVLGIEQSWEELKRDLARAGPSCPGTIYLKTISAQGPEIFAVMNDEKVFYHEDGKWYQFITAYNIKFETTQANVQIEGHRAMNESDWVIVP
jgi:hypothetical protein